MLKFIYIKRGVRPQHPNNKEWIKHMPHRKYKRLAALVLIAALALLAALMPAGCSDAPKETSPDITNGQPTVNNLINFENDNHGFMRSYESSPDAARAVLSIAVTDGDTASGKGVLIESDHDGTIYIAADLSSLLGDRVADMRVLEADIAVVNDYEEFYAVSGEITILDAQGSAVANGVWSVYIKEKNPNVIHLELPGAIPPGPYNMLILSKTVDNAVSAGLRQSNLLITEMRFYDANAQLLPINNDAGFNAPDGFGEQDRSNLIAISDETAINGARGSSSGWGQAVVLPTVKNGGPLDPKALEDCVLTVYYSSDSPPELILQSWTEGKPDSAGWAKVAPARVNGSGNIAQYDYKDMISSFGTDDFEAFLDQFYVGDTGAELKVFSVTLMNANGV